MVPMHHGCVVITLSRTWRSLGKIEHNVGGHGLAQRSDMKFLSPDSGLMRGWNNLTDGVWINILMLVTSIPLVTVGAALTAGHARRLRERDTSPPIISDHSKVIL